MQEEDTRLAVLSTRRIELLHLTRPRWPLPLTHRHATGDGQAEPVILGQMRRTVVAELPRARERARVCSEAIFLTMLTKAHAQGRRKFFNTHAARRQNDFQAISGTPAQDRMGSLLVRTRLPGAYPGRSLIADLYPLQPRSAARASHSSKSQRNFRPRRRSDHYLPCASSLDRCSAFGGEPLVKLPAGTTIISGDYWQCPAHSTGKLWRFSSEATLLWALCILWLRLIRNDCHCAVPCPTERASPQGSACGDSLRGSDAPMGWTTGAQKM